MLFCLEYWNGTCYAQILHFILSSATQTEEKIEDVAMWY